MLVNEAAEWLTGELEAERTDARIVVETFFGQDVERPQIAPTEAAARQTISSHGDAGRALQSVPRATDVFAELRRRHLIDMLVKEALAGYLMTAPHNLGDHLRLMLGDPAKNEKCGFGANVVEKVERRVRVPLYTAFES
jgi:hypothetical protein